MVLCISMISMMTLLSFVLLFIEYSLSLSVCLSVSMSVCLCYSRKCLSIFTIFSKKQLVDLLISSTALLFSGLFIFALIFISSFFLLALGLVYSFSSSWDIKLHWANLQTGLHNDSWLGGISGCVPKWDGATGWTPCSGRAAGRVCSQSLQSDKTSGCALQSGRATSYASELGWATVWASWPDSLLAVLYCCTGDWLGSLVGSVL